MGAPHHGGLEGGGWRNAVLSYANQGATSLFTTVEDLGRWISEMEKLFPVDRNRFGRFGWGLNSVEFSFGEDGMADGFRATGGRVRNLRFHRVEELSKGGKIDGRIGG